MVKGNTKRIVVIKDIPSNIIEEAILILKNEPGAKGSGLKEAIHKKRAVNNDYLIKEAESVIGNYIKEIRLDTLQNVQLQPQAKAAKNRFTVNTVINFALVGSIALLIFLVSRMI